MVFFAAIKPITKQAFPKQAVVYMCLQYKSFENTVGKGEIAQIEIAHSVFYPL